MDTPDVSSAVQQLRQGNLGRGKRTRYHRPLKGVYNDRLSVPRYTSTWNVQQVLDYIETLGDPSSLPLKLLLWKTAFLLALTWPSRSADLSKLDRTSKQYRQDGLAFIPRDLAKQSKQGRPIAEFFSLPSQRSQRFAQSRLWKHTCNKCSKLPIATNLSH